jgi:hypothetical protein
MMVLAPVCDSDLTARAGLLPVNVIVTPKRYESIQTLACTGIGLYRTSTARVGVLVKPSNVTPSSHYMTGHLDPGHAPSPTGPLAPVCDSCSRAKGFLLHSRDSHECAGIPHTRMPNSRAREYWRPAVRSRNSRHRTTGNLEELPRYRPIPVQSYSGAGRFQCRPIPVQAYSGAGLFQCRQIPARAYSGAGLFRCRPISVQAYSGAGLFRCRPISVQAYSGAGSCSHLTVYIPSFFRTW